MTLNNHGLRNQRLYTVRLLNLPLHHWGRMAERQRLAQCARIIIKAACLLHFCLFFQTAFAQQRPHYAQYNQNNFLLNPAIAGIESYADGRVGYRRQWAGLDEAPRTFYLTAHLPIANPDFEIEPASPRYVQPRYKRQSPLPDAHAGVGFTIVQDQAGPWSQLSMSVSGAYHYPLDDYWQVSGGISAGLTQHTLDFDRIRLATPRDPVVTTGKIAAFRPDFHAGLWLYSPEFFAGFSVQQLISNRLRFREGEYEWQGKLVPHFFFTTGYQLAITDDWDFLPSVMFKKAQNTPLSWDLNLKISYINHLWLGVSYRQRDALMAWIGTRFAQKFTVSYGYEYPLSVVQAASSGSHEIVLGLTLGNRHHYTSPRGFW